MTVGDAAQNCHRDRHCPSGLNGDCPPAMSCWVDVQGCNIYELPSMKPTISFEPTPRPTPLPTTRDPSWTYEPTASPLEKDDIRNFFFCGTSWGDASSRCHQRCLSGHHSECPAEEECFAQAACKKLIKNQPTSLSDDDESKSNNDLEVSSLNTPTEEDTPEPTSSPLEKVLCSSQLQKWCHRSRYLIPINATHPISIRRNTIPHHESSADQSAHRTSTNPLSGIRTVILTSFTSHGKSHDSLPHQPSHVRTMRRRTLLEQGTLPIQSKLLRSWEVLLQ
mmetsp:Transcript_20052/g.37757  ORF Transcript_20052/g.37757 Transcript_20052/m.37757 type:complete len:279 (-) Transcript_20052:670-1506(-)